MVNVFMVNVFLINVFMVNVFMLKVFMLKVFMVNVFLVNVVAPLELNPLWSQVFQPSDEILPPGSKKILSFEPIQ
jgi:hypothetical protein